MKYSKVQRNISRNAIQSLYEDHTASIDFMPTEEEMGLDNIIEKIKNYIRNGFPLKWTSKFILSNNEEKTGYCENATIFAFDFSDFKGKAEIMNTVRFFFFISNDKEPIEFFINDNNGDDLGYYFQSYSSINNKNKEDNFGSIFINLRYLLQEYMDCGKDMQKLFDDLEELLYHELRHYYDNLIGIFSVSNNDYTIVDLELWADECLNIDYNKIENFSEIKGISYVIDVTELNAFTHSFYVLIKKYIEKTPGITKDKIIEHIYTTSEKIYPYYIYTLNTMFNDCNDFISYLKKFGINILETYYYIFSKTKTTFKFTKEQCQKFNNIFNEKYLDTINASREEIERNLPIAFIKFMEKEYIPYIFFIFYNNYKKVFNNMNNIIDFLLNKYNEKNN